MPRVEPKVGDSVSFTGKVIQINNYEFDKKAHVQLHSGEIVEISLDNMVLTTSLIGGPGKPSLPDKPEKPELPEKPIDPIKPILPEPK